jgi:hypothetical protein
MGGMEWGRHLGKGIKHLHYFAILPKGNLEGINYNGVYIRIWREFTN